MLAILRHQMRQEVEFSVIIIESLFAILSGLSVFVLCFGRDLAIHVIIDRHLFKVRRKTGTVIKQNMLLAAERSGAKDWELLKSPEMNDEVFRIFYHFINNEHETKELSHKYFDAYYTNIVSVVVGVVFFVATVWRFRVGYYIPIPSLLILGVVGMLSISTSQILVPKIYRLSVQQILEIRPEELKAEIELRLRRRCETTTEKEDGREATNGLAVALAS